MGLIKEGKLVNDPFKNVSACDTVPTKGPVIVSIDQWIVRRDDLLKRNSLIGIWLKSDEHPEAIAGDLVHLSLIALEFPSFRDGRAYSYARLLRDKYDFSGEIRAVGDVLLDQLHFMVRSGFDAFEVESEDPLGAYNIAAADYSVWYQQTGDGRLSAAELRDKGVRR
ncbi:MAG: DUF934 domain-containing protein [Pseudomonadota bacterium]|nr:DUF934 domain-containing protein [Pseudomonadota bacterium]